MKGYGIGCGVKRCGLLGYSHRPSSAVSDGASGTGNEGQWEGCGASSGAAAIRRWTDWQFLVHDPHHESSAYP